MRISKLSPVRLRVKELRTAKGWTQARLATEAKVREATIGAIENGQTSGVDFGVLERLAVALGVDPGFLVVRTAAKKKGER